MKHAASRKNYRLIEHTADIGIRLKSRDKKGLFRDAAKAMFDIIASPKSLTQKSKSTGLTIDKTGLDTEDLLVNWLNELLSLSSEKSLIFNRFKINSIGSDSLSADVSGSPYGDFVLNKEIKAATYHGLKITKVKGFWMTEVIFDV